MIYFDNSATTKCSKKVIDIMNYAMEYNWGNPSSVHTMGKKSKEALDIAREKIAFTLGKNVSPKSIVFTSGGSESNNFAIFGSALHNKNKTRIITSKIEHPCVIAPCNRLKNILNYDSIFLETDKYGLVDKEQLKESLNDNTLLVSIMHVNNEIGTIQDIKEIGQIIKNYNENILFHVDATQGYGKIPFDVDDYNIDLLTISGHKINGPKGVGFLYIKNTKTIDSMIIGGSQQNAMRAGTENVYNIIGLGESCKENYDTLEKRINQMRSVQDYFSSLLISLDDVVIHGPKDAKHRAPHIISAGFKNINNFELMDELSKNDIMVSAGSACSCLKERNDASTTLRAIKTSDEFLHSTIRFSFDHNNTIEEAKYVFDKLKQIINELKCK